MPDRPVALCDVLRCYEPVHTHLKVQPQGTLRRVAVVCYEHSEQIAEGARWHFHDVQRDTEVGAGKSFLMGSDLPPMLASSRVATTWASGGEVPVISLRLASAEGTLEELRSFEISVDQAEALVQSLRPRLMGPKDQ